MEDKFTPYFNGPSIKQILIFELSSFFGRKFKRKRSKITSNNNPLLVDIGVGSNYTQGWLHVDFFKFPKLKFWKKSLKIRPDVETDLRFPLNCAENIVDGNHCGHTIEHLYPKAAYHYLTKCSEYCNLVAGLELISLIWVNILTIIIEIRAILIFRFIKPGGRQLVI